MLTFAERQQVQLELANVFGQSNYKNVVSTLLGPEGAALNTQLAPVYATHAEAAEAVLRHIVEARWTHDPSLLERLLSGLVRGGAAQFAATLARVKQKEDPNLDPLGSSWLSADRPFFGRTDSRRCVQKLLDSNARPILVVAGAHHSGKSYTCDWLDYLAGVQRCDFRIILETLEEKGGPSMDADFLTASIVSKLPQQMAPHNITPAQNRYEQRLSDWIVNNVLQAPGRTWIVLDGFGDQDLTESAKKLIQHLAVAVLKDVVNRRARLVLVDFDFEARLGHVDPNRIVYDNLSDPSGIQADDLTSCLHQHFAEAKQDVDKEFVSELARKLIDRARALKQDVSFAGKPELRLLNHVLSEMRRAPTTPPGAAGAGP
jgi:hypothetical protein